MSKGERNRKQRARYFGRVRARHLYSAPTTSKRVTLHFHSMNAAQAYANLHLEPYEYLALYDRFAMSNKEIRVYSDMHETRTTMEQEDEL